MNNFTESMPNFVFFCGLNFVDERFITVDEHEKY